MRRSSIRLTSVSASVSVSASASASLSLPLPSASLPLPQSSQSQPTLRLPHALPLTSFLPVTPHTRLPSHLKTSPPSGPTYLGIKSDLRGLGLATVCEEAKCPNIGECWGGSERGGATATIMLLGDTCTRACRFCSVSTSRTPPPADPQEPLKTALAIQKWGIGYVVLTSVDRDDMPDSGAAHFGETVRQIKRQSSGRVLVEALTGDFAGDLRGVASVIEGGVDVYAHNVETVPRLQAAVRDRRAGWEQSLAVLREAHRLGEGSGVITKTSMMLGLGETLPEVLEALKELRKANVSVVTFGQYMRPTKSHIKVTEYVDPKVFDHLKVLAEEMGFLYVASGPLVRSSYKAGEMFIENILKKRRSGAEAIVGAERVRRVEEGIRVGA